MAVTRLAQHVPFLRRYARALTGSQREGDAAVQSTLERALSGDIVLLDDPSPRIVLFEAFHRSWSGRDDAAVDGDSVADDRLQVLSARRRAALLLTLMEGFSNGQAATILHASAQQVEADVRDALFEIDQELGTDVLIIEDEPIIALDLERMVRELGHDVIGVGHTRDEGVALAKNSRPGLVLADVHLADGSSGLETAVDILRDHDVPVIFITAYPERLLTGVKPEPAYLVSKPYEDEQVKAVIGQALFFHRPGRPATSRAQEPSREAAVHAGDER